MNNLMLIYINEITIAVGIVATLTSLILGVKFRGTTDLGNRLSLMAFAESYGMFATTFFAAAALFGWMSELNGVFQAFLRLSIFMSALITTLRIHRFYKNGKDSNK